MITRRWTAVLLAAVLFPALASAESLEEKKSKKKHDAELVDILKAFNDACGTKATASIDWSKVKWPDWEGISISSYCGHPLSAMTSMCADADSKEHIAKNMKKMTCRFGAKGKDKIDIKLKGGAMDWTIVPEGSNMEDFAKDFVMKKM